MRRLLVAAVATVVVLGSLVSGGLLMLGGGERADTPAATSGPATATTAQIGAPPSAPAPATAATPMPAAPPQVATAPTATTRQTATPTQAAAAPPPGAPTNAATSSQAATPSQAAAPQAAAPSAPATATASPPAAMVAPRPAPPLASPVPPLPAIVMPSFDVVRVAPNGSAVIAGRAAPGARVTVKDGEKDLGTAVADGRGEWVLLPSAPLTPGGRTLSLAAKLGEGPAVASEREVVLVVPERQKDIAGQPAAQPGQSLALSVPRIEGAGPSTVLQAPPAQRPPAVAPAPQGQVTVDVIDYDKAGRVIFSGKAQPEGDVRIYLDNRLVGEAPSGAAPWRLTPEAEVPPGNYTLRADLLGAGGRVVARVELPFQRAEVTPEVLAGGSVVVQPGYSLWRIARRAYGEGVFYTLIYSVNAEQIRDPDLIYPGQVFLLPKPPPNSVPYPDARG